MDQCHYAIFIDLTSKSRTDDTARSKLQIATMYTMLHIYNVFNTILIPLQVSVPLFY